MRFSPFEVNLKFMIKQRGSLSPMHHINERAFISVLEEELTAKE